MRYGTQSHLCLHLEVQKLDFDVGGRLEVHRLASEDLVRNTRMHVVAAEQIQLN
jgi:hypothetical protein